LAFEHLWVNASWLVGSGGTVILDFIVLGQFWYYRRERRQTELTEGDDEVA
jgi:predicted kinase